MCVSKRTLKTALQKSDWSHNENSHNFRDFKGAKEAIVYRIDKLDFMQFPGHSADLTLILLFQIFQNHRFLSLRLQKRGESTAETASRRLFSLSLPSDRTSEKAYKP